MHALFLIPTALDFFSLLQGAHKPLDMERNPAHGALDQTLKHWERARLLEVLTNVCLNREIQFCAFLGSSRALYLCFQDKDPRERKNREGSIPTVHLELWPAAIECKVEGFRFLFFFSFNESGIEKVLGPCFLLRKVIRKTRRRLLFKRSRTSISPNRMLCGEKGLETGQKGSVKSLIEQ